MNSPRRNLAALALLVASLVALSVLDSAPGHGNRVDLATGLAVDVSVDSTSLFCTGFSGSAGLAPATVVFWNSTTAPRSVTATVGGNDGSSVVHEFLVPSRSSYRLSAADFPGKGYFGVSAVVQGGGVSAIVSGSGDSSANVPCVNNGSSAWALSGFSTRQGVSSVVTFLNPTAVEAVVNMTTVGAGGFAAPANYQGLVVPAHGVIATNLGAQIVNDPNFMLDVNVVRGSIVTAAAVAWTSPVKGATSVGGTTTVGQHFTFANLPTNAQATAELSLANPSQLTADVTIQLFQLPGCARDHSCIAPFTVSLPSQTVTNFMVSPSTRVPAAGARGIAVDASAPIVATLLTHGGSATSGPWIVPAGVAGTTQLLLADGEGFGSVAVVNASALPASVTMTVEGGRGNAVWNFVVSPLGWRDVGVLSTQSNASRPAIEIVSSQNVYVAGDLRGLPKGVRVVTPSGGRQ